MNGNLSSFLFHIRLGGYPCTQCSVIICSCAIQAPNIMKSYIMKLIVFKWQVSRHALDLCIDWSIACLYIQKFRRALQKSCRFRDRLTFIYKLRMRKVILSLNARIRNLVSHKLRKMSQLRLWRMPKSHFPFWQAPKIYRVFAAIHMW